MSAILLVDNLASLVQYPLHAVTADEEPAGSEAFRFATGRRGDHAAASTLNDDWFLKIVCDRVRAFDFVCLWDHNLAGETLRWQASDDDFGTIQTLFDATLPTISATGDVDDALGVLTEDGMWLKRVPVRAAKAIRLFVPAMGANQRPSINGLVGLSYAFDRDLGDLVDATELQTTEERSEAGYVGRGVRAVGRSGAVPIKLPSLFDYEQFRYHLHRYGHGAPAPLVFDEARAEQAVMAIRPIGRLGFRQGRDYFYPTGELPFQEHEPVEVDA